jgi:hypothetical protein
MPFIIFIKMELNFQKMNSFFLSIDQLILTNNV